MLQCFEIAEVSVGYMHEIWSSVIRCDCVFAAYENNSFIFSTYRAQICHVYAARDRDQIIIVEMFATTYFTLRCVAACSVIFQL